MGEYLDNETGLKITTKFIKTELYIVIYIQGRGISSMHIHVDQEGNVFSSDHKGKRFPVKWSFK